MNTVEQYYLNQVGSGIQGFQGHRYQRGAGFWGNLWSKVGFPVLKFLGREAAAGGLGLAADALEGKNMKQSAISQLKSGGRNTVGYLQKMLDQTGSGRRKKRRQKKRIGKPRKTIKRKRRRTKKSFNPKSPKRRRRRKSKKSGEWL